MAKVFITGVTGFLGSNIARILIQNDHDIIATYRLCSSKQNCVDFASKITWVLQDGTDDWIIQVCIHKPQIVIHCAWIGVTHIERNNWDSQYLNVTYLNHILSITKESGATKFIGLGSQAEYGIFSGIITEDHPLNPKEAYGCIKVICSEIVKQYCTFHQTGWYWLRLFSFFGKGESEKWLIPSLVKKMQTETQMDFTAGEQQYAYLYVNDLGRAINNIIVNKGNSGVFNISGKKLLTLKYFIETIRNNVNPSFQLNFGALPYRENQPMQMQGDSSKFINTFGKFEVSDFEHSLSETIEHLKENLK